MMTTGVQPVSVAEPAQCPTCGTELLGKFCSNCGEKQHHEEELALKHFALHGLHELTHLDSKVFATVRYLYARPGYLTQEYVAGRRSLYMKPLSLFLMVCALYFLVDSFFPRSVYDINWLTHQDKRNNVDLLWTKLAAKKHVSKEAFVERVQVSIHKISTIMQFGNVVVIAAILALLYRKRYFVEHLVFAFHFLSFVFLTASAMHTLTYRLDVYSRASYLTSAATAIMYFVYLLLSLRRVYQQSAGLTLAKGLVMLVITWLAVICTQLLALAAAIVLAVKS